MVMGLQPIQTQGSASARQPGRVEHVDDVGALLVVAAARGEEDPVAAEQADDNQDQPARAQIEMKQAGAESGEGDALQHTEPADVLQATPIPAVAEAAI